MSKNDASHSIILCRNTCPLAKKLNCVSKTKGIFKLGPKVTFNRRWLLFALNKEPKLWSDFWMEQGVCHLCSRAAFDLVLMANIYDPEAQRYVITSF